MEQDHRVRDPEPLDRARDRQVEVWEEAEDAVGWAVIALVQAREAFVFARTVNCPCNIKWVSHVIT